MKTLAQLGSIMILFVGLSSNGYAQPEPISRQAFDTAVRSAVHNSYKFSRRVTKVGKNYDEYGKVIRTNSSIFASLLPKGFYTIYETEENGKSTRIETIKIADVMYKRHDNGSWKLLGKRLEENVGIIPSSLSYAKTSKERVTVDGVSLWLYQAIIQSVPSRGNPDDKLAVWSLQCWIDMKGRMTRTIQQSRPPLSSEFREDVYEYDPKDLKIEAPIK